MAAAPGDENRFALVVLRLDGKMLEMKCKARGEMGFVAVNEFTATRCGSARCGSHQGRTE